MSVVCCQIEVSATERSLVQMSPIEGGVSMIDEPHRRDLGPLRLSRHDEKIKNVTQCAHM
jgi:hypothetical protein